MPRLANDFARIALLFALLASANAHAQQADIALTATLAPGTRLPPGSEATVTLTVRNLGPSALNSNGGFSANAMSDYYFIGGAGENIIVYPVAATVPCIFVSESVDPVPGNAAATTAIVKFPPLAAGQSVTCTVGVVVQAGALGSYDLTFNATPASGSIVDPNASNNGVAFRLLMTEIAATPVPAFDFGATSILVLLILAIATRSSTYEKANPGGCS